MPWITHLADRDVVWFWIAGIGILVGWQCAQKAKIDLSNRQQLASIVKAGLFFGWYASVIYGIKGGLIVGVFFR
jgi:hypothetical protein